MTPFEADTKRDALDKAERDAARYLRSTFECLLEAVQEAHAEYRVLVDPSMCYESEDLRAAEQRLRDVLRLATITTEG